MRVIGLPRPRATAATEESSSPVPWRLQIDHEFETSRLLDGKITWLGTLQDPVDVPGGDLAYASCGGPKAIRPPSGRTRVVPTTASGKRFAWAKAAMTSAVGPESTVPGEARSPRSSHGGWLQTQARNRSCRTSTICGLIPKATASALSLLGIGRCVIVGWIDEQGDAPQLGNRFLEELDHLATEFVGEVARAGDIAARLAEVRDDPETRPGSPRQP